MRRTGYESQGWLTSLTRCFGVCCVHAEQTAHHRCRFVELCLEIPFSICPLRLQSDYLVQAWCMAPYKSVLGSVIRRGKYAGQRSVFEQLGYIWRGCFGFARDGCCGFSSFTEPSANEKRIQSITLLARSVRSY